MSVSSMPCGILRTRSTARLPPSPSPRPHPDPLPQGEGEPFAPLRQSRSRSNVCHGVTSIPVPKAHSAPIAVSLSLRERVRVRGT